MTAAKADISRIFVDRPILAAVLSILIFVAGLLAIPNLPISEYPPVSPPTIQVTAFYPGANPKTIAETVAAPLEEAITGVDKMIYMKSAAASDGTLVLTVTFELDADVDLAAIQVQNRVAQAQPRLPEAVRQLGVTTEKASPNITLVVHITSPQGTYDGLYLSNYATLNVRDELARLPGVGQAQVFGGGNYAMRVWIDPERAAERSLTATDIVAAIREQNVQVSAGAIGAPPQRSSRGVQYSIDAKGRLETPAQFEQIVLKTEAGGAITRLKDVARVELGADSYASNSLLDNEEAAAIVIFQAPGANSIALSDAVRERMAELEAGFPQDLTWEVAYDPTVFVRHSIESVLHTLLEATLLVVLVVVLFLQTWRASIIPLIAVPVSIVGAFAVLWLLGFSINVLTLFGLVLAIGIVVDDAIVVVENVERHVEDGLSPRDAAHKAMSEVSGPIIAITLVLVSVFVPLAFLDGVTGQFYRQFAVSIAASVTISGINSLTLSPALAAVILQPRGARKDLPGRLIDRILGGPFGAFNRVFNGAAQRYASGITGIIGRAPRLLVIYGMLLVVTVFAFRSVPAGFIPTQDKQYLFAGVQLPEGASLARTEAAMAQMADIALATPGVEHTVQFPGLNGVHFVNTPNLGVMFVGLEPAEERATSAPEIANKLSMAFGAVSDGLAFAFMPPPVFGYGNAAGFEMYVQDRSDLGYGDLNAQVQAFTGAFAQADGFGPGSVITTFQSNMPQLEAQVDRVKLKQQGLTLTEVFGALETYLGSTYVNDINIFGRTYSVYAQADAPFRDDISDVGRLQVRNPGGEMVPLANLVSIEETFGPDPVIRYNGYPAADVQGAPRSPMISAAEAVKVADALAEQTLPAGMRVEWTGLTFQQLAEGNATLLVFPVCVLLVFLVLAALYESWTLPLAVILIVPMCLFSAVGGIWLLNTIRGLIFGIKIGAGVIMPPPMSVPPTFIDINVFTQIGLVVLLGLACKNAILIVEFARDLEREGRSTMEAAVEACRLRLRPILMTSFAFIAGVVPLVFASGAGAEVRHVMGVTVFGGMLGVTFFGLFLTPVFYVVLRRLSSRRPGTTTVDAPARTGGSADPVEA
jgi:hydrophobe/amphiphile efflux-1 (HAE1) family protein